MATAVPTEVAPLRRAVVAYARSTGVEPPVLDKLALAVSELLTNVVLHAYPDGRPPGAMAVTAELAGSEMRVAITDDGVGLAPDLSPRYGLGLTIASEVADRIELASAADGGTVVRLVFAARG